MLPPLATEPEESDNASDWAIHVNKQELMQINKAVRRKESMSMIFSSFYKI